MPKITPEVGSKRTQNRGLKWTKFRMPREDEDVIVEYSNGSHQIVQWEPDLGFHCPHDLDGQEVTAWAYIDSAWLGG